MQEKATINGRDFKEMFTVATNWLEKSVDEVNALNVFPVPDGDTGTNMLLTMHSALDEIKSAEDSVSKVVREMARGALMGARGNSGVILSQILAGMSQGLANNETAEGTIMAKSFESASKSAYKGVTNPVEGTILTVIKDVAKATKAKNLSGTDNLISIMEEAVSAAGTSVANTPSLLKVLKEAGVVDAGGQGLYVILDGALRYLKGETEAMQFRKPQIIASSVPLGAASVFSPEHSHEDEEPFGYCTNLLLKGQALSVEKITTKLDKKGESLVVVGDENTIRVHIHTLDPGSVISYLTTLGTLDNVNIQNMDEQHEDYMEMKKDKSPAGDISLVAVVAGDGFSEVFSSLGVGRIVPGGQTMNPSTKEILRSVEKSGGHNVIVLPNNKNIIMSAEQVQNLTKKKIKVVPTKTMPQGVAALLAFDYDADFDTNHRLMTDAIGTVKTIEVTRAIRSTKTDNINIKRNQIISILDGKIVSVADDYNKSIRQALGKINLTEAEVVTIYYGEAATEEEAESISAMISKNYSHLQIELVKGGQRHYNFILSVE